MGRRGGGGGERESGEEGKSGEKGKVHSQHYTSGGHLLT